MQIPHHEEKQQEGKNLQKAKRLLKYRHTEIMS